MLPKVKWLSNIFHTLCKCSLLIKLILFSFLMYVYNIFPLTTCVCVCAACICCTGFQISFVFLLFFFLSVYICVCVSSLEVLLHYMLLLRFIGILLCLGVYKIVNVCVCSHEYCKCFQLAHIL